MEVEHKIKDTLELKLNRGHTNNLEEFVGRAPEEIRKRHIMNPIMDNLEKQIASQQGKDITVIKLSREHMSMVLTWFGRTTMQGFEDPVYHDLTVEINIQIQEQQQLLPMPIQQPDETPDKDSLGKKKRKKKGKVLLHGKTG